MRKAAALLLLTLAACRAQVDEYYATWAHAKEAGALERGWIPAFVPTTAQDIRDTHDLDISRQTLRFTASPSDVAAMVAGLSRVSIENEPEAAKLAKAYGMTGVSEAYVECSRPLKGALVVDRESGRVLYTTAVLWAEEECSEAGDARGMAPLPATGRSARRPG